MKPRWSGSRRGTRGSFRLWGREQLVAEDVPKFLNDGLRHIWPRVSEYFIRVLASSVQTAVQESLPSAFNGRLTFDKERCHLGQEPPSFRAIRVSRAYQETFKGEAENLCFRCDFEWDGDCSILLRCGAVGLGIRSFTLRGSLDLELVSMCSEPPMCKGARVFLLNPPEVSFKWQGAAQVDCIGLVKRTLLQTIKQQIADTMVVPNMLGFALSDDLDIFVVRNPQPAGLLRFTVHRAEGLLAVDRNLLGQPNSSDPFFELRCGAQSARSATQYKNLTPTYEHTVFLLVTSVEQQNLQLTLYDENVVSPEHFLGAVELPVLDVISWGRRRQALELADGSGCVGTSGRVFCSAEWRPLLMDPKNMVADMVCYAFAGLYSASGVPTLGTGAEHWVSAECSHLTPNSPRPATQESPHLTDDGASRETMEAEASKKKAKVLLMQSHGMSVEDMSKVLDADSDTLLHLMRPASLPPAEEPTGPPSASRSTQRLVFEHAFQFLVSDPGAAVMTFWLMRKAPGRKALDPDVCSVNLDAVLKAPKYALSKTLMTKDGARLDFRFQLRFFAAPTDEMWFDAED